MRNPARRFEDLVVWQKSHALTLDIYRRTEAFPRREIYGITSQVRRAAYSVPANIAEGFRKRGKNDKLRFLNIAEASLDETRYFLILARDPGFLDPEELFLQIEQVSKLLDGYTKAIRRDSL
ncbi:four helix bundle protein [Stratiformator vulcanicus]|uniref:Four helix bundle protein n=1 Tax=Stratiformator vulcanicus TaxID=2527980 RepID=A0A517QY13_9PLAN|nr:four helix bundle protein [Stratiformator vulcanicus]QDT36556.1 hypothetical protein Pan189_09160 [Stratiformator vulcanicus]